MEIFDFATLGIATVMMAGALLLEHEYTGRRHWPEQWYYAEGLLTVLVGLLAWAALVQVTVTWEVAIAMLLAGCASGGPDFLVIHAEGRRREAEACRRQAAWDALERQNAELASQLQVLLTKRTNSNYFHRLRDMVESFAFAAGTIAQEREYMDGIGGHAEQMLAELQAMMGGDEKKGPAGRKE